MELLDQAHPTSVVVRTICNSTFASRCVRNMGPAAQNAGGSPAVDPRMALNEARGLSTEDKGEARRICTPLTALHAHGTGRSERIGRGSFRRAIAC